MSPVNTDESVGTKPNNDDNSEDNYVGTASRQSDTEHKDNPTGSECRQEILAEGTDENNTVYNIISASSFTDTSSITSSMKADFSLAFDFDEVVDGLPCLDADTLVAENKHLKELLVTKLNLIEEQAKITRDQLMEEILVMKRRLTTMEGTSDQGQTAPAMPPRESSPTSTPSPVPPRELSFCLQDYDGLQYPGIHR